MAVKKEGIENSQQGKQGGHVSGSIDFFFKTQVPATVTVVIFLPKHRQYIFPWSKDFSSLGLKCPLRGGRGPTKVCNRRGEAVFECATDEVAMEEGRACKVFDVFPPLRELSSSET